MRYFRNIKNLCYESDELLVVYFENLCLPITLRYFNTLKKDFLLSETEIRAIIFQTFESFSKKIKERPVYDVDRYFKYLYLQNIKAEIRRLTQLKFVHNRASLEYGNIYDIENSLIFVAQDDKYEACKDEIFKALTNKKSSLLSKDEKQMLISYIKGYSLREISQELDLCYSSCHRKFEAIIYKCRQYIYEYHHEVYEENNNESKA